jgi:hypothetical protein
LHCAKAPPIARAFSAVAFSQPQNGKGHFSMTTKPVASFYIKDGVGFTTAEGAALLEKARGSGGLPFKVVGTDELTRRGSRQAARGMCGLVVKDAALSGGRFFTSPIENRKVER